MSLPPLPKDSPPWEDKMTDRIVPISPRADKPTSDEMQIVIQYLFNEGARLPWGDEQKAMIQVASWLQDRL